MASLLNEFVAIHAASVQIKFMVQATHHEIHCCVGVHREHVGLTASTVNFVSLLRSPRFPRLSFAITCRK